MARKTAVYSVDRVASDFFLDVAVGRVAGWAHVNKFGHNPDVDMTPDEDIWEVGGDYTGFITTPTTLEMFSSDANDTVAGTGAQIIELQGLDSDFLEQTEQVAMSGAGTVISLNKYVRINRVFVVSVGSVGANIGVVTVQDTQPVTMASIAINDNQTHQAVYTVPTDKQGLITVVWAGIGTGSAAGVATDIELLIRPFGQALRTMFLLGLTSHWSHNLMPPIHVEAKSDIKLRSVGNSANNSNITAGFDIVLVDI